ncbi:hypothetical protein HOG17_02585 [Candidatus Peregrinibacteria bacterium]|jgi:hypothetical protein|nr:hypothetical protein [Candidatus Peregrinibacteria bacterium]MBT4147931.1 hypothetical protein [Candidatus Peregrinibacteria bacterium]MBT4366373.1 hypothetical protein [Candidatus Peregrinibacteria bacterium]MBT4456097.1 hypothetical protein [Candidatus Peregrinibacteria bacterium]
MTDVPARILHPEDIPLEDQHPDLATLPEGLRPTTQGERTRTMLLDELSKVGGISTAMLTIKDRMEDANQSCRNMFNIYANGLLPADQERFPDGHPQKEWVNQYHQLKEIYDLLDKVRKTHQKKGEQTEREERKAERATELGQSEGEVRVKAARQMIDKSVASITSALSRAIGLIRKIPQEYLTFQRWEWYP